MTSKIHWYRPLCALAFLFLGVMGWTLHGGMAKDSPGLVYEIIGLSPAVLPLLAVGIACALAVGGGGGFRSGMTFLMGGTDDARAMQAQRALRAGARGVLSAGLVISLMAAFAAFLLARKGMVGPGEHPDISPAQLAGVLHHTLFTPIVALALGHGLLGGAADAAALSAGESRTTSRPRRDNLFLLMFLLPGLLGLFAAVWPISSL